MTKYITKPTMRSITEKEIMSMPDNFDVIKVRELENEGIIRDDDIFIVSQKADEDSKLPDAGDTYHRLKPNQTIELITGDKVLLVGKTRNYSAIQVFNPGFGDNLTDININGEMRNLSELNDFIDGYCLLGLFRQIVIPSDDEDMIIIAYRGA